MHLGFRERPSNGSGGLVVGVDSGGSGLRIALADAATGTVLGDRASREPVRTGPGGISAAHFLEQVLPAVRALTEPFGGRPVLAAAVGAAGMATLGDELRAELPGALAAAWGCGGSRSRPTRSPRTRGRSDSGRARSSRAARG